MDKLERSKEVIDLGRRLVAQLDTKEDLLAHWLAHHVAARISAAETALPEDEAAARDACFSSILELWEHRNTLPERLRPFRELEPVLRTLAALDVDGEQEHRFYRPALREAAVADADENTKTWLELAIGLDRTARELVRFALVTASEKACESAEPWVKLAEEAGADTMPEIVVVGFMYGERTPESEAKAESRRILKRALQLESFSELAAARAVELRLQVPEDMRDDQSVDDDIDD